MFEEEPLLYSRKEQEKFYHTSSDRSNLARAFVTKYYCLVSNPTQLRLVEQRVLKNVTSEYTQEQVIIGPYTSVNTLHFRCKADKATPSPSLPLVMIHGFGVGLGMFVKNFDTICQCTDVYAIDILGFGRSSRPNFSRRPKKIIQQFVNSLEDWRRAVGLDRFILLGHSFGGYLSTWYAIAFPESVAKLILVEPWGYTAFETGRARDSRRRTFYKSIVSLIRSTSMKYFQPFAFVRLGFGIGKPLFRKFRRDLIVSYDEMVDADTLSDYFLHLNGQYPSGEEAFTRLHIPFGWCQELLMPDSIKRLDPNIPMDFIYGNLSWMSSDPANELNGLIENTVTVTMVPHSSHHVYANNTDEFNQIVTNSILSLNMSVMSELIWII